MVEVDRQRGVHPGRQSETEALLVEQNFIKQYQPQFNIRLRDDKSYPYIAISMDEPFPRVYFTREKHRKTRLYFGPVLERQADAVDARDARQGLPVPLVQRRRSPGRRSGLAVPRLLHQALRGARASTTASTREQYMESIDGVRAFLSGRYRDIERDLEARMKAAAAAAGVRAGRAGAQPAGGGAVAAAAPAGGQRGARHGRRRRGRRRRHRRQRPGLPAARRRAERPPVVLPGQHPGGRASGRSRRSSCCSTTARRR